LSQTASPPPAAADAAAESSSPPLAAPPQAAPPGTGAQTPPARLIKPRTEPHPVERAHPRPLDERCRPLKDQLEAELQRPGNAHRIFQARLAHNAGNRLCREGRVDRGMAEFQRGLSLLQDTSHP
jgi:hypothetical protein